MKLIWLLDFDNTISGTFIHNIIEASDLGGLCEEEKRLYSECGEDYKKLEKELADLTEKRWALVDDCVPAGPSGEWKKIIEQMIDQGHLVAIVTFNNYPLIIRRFLNQSVGLSTEYVNQIYLKWGCADRDTNPETKVDYIKETIEKLKEKYPTKAVSLNRSLFIDDSPPNCVAAQKEGIHTYLFVPTQNFFDKIYKVLEGVRTLMDEVKDEKNSLITCPQDHKFFASPSIALIEEKVAGEKGKRKRETPVVQSVPKDEEYCTLEEFEEKMRGQLFAHKNKKRQVVAEQPPHTDSPSPLSKNI